MDSLIRIGGRLFNLTHVTSIEPGEDSGQCVVDVHIVAGRTVRLREDDAKAAGNFVRSFIAIPVDMSENEIQAAQDEHGLALNEEPDD